jgi:hypothetical protein
MKQERIENVKSSNLSRARPNESHLHPSKPKPDQEIKEAFLPDDE